MILNSKKLEKALAQLLPVIDAGSLVPAMEHLRIAPAADGTLTLTAVNFRESLHLGVAADVEQASEPMLPNARMLAGLVASLAEQPIRLERAKGHVSLTADAGTYSIVAINPGDFVRALDANPDDPSVTLSCDELAAALDAVMFAASRDPLRMAMTCVHFHYVDGKLRLVATDGHRLAMRTIDAPAGGLPRLAHNLPHKSAATLRRVVDAAGTVRVSWNDKVMAFVTDRARLVCNLMSDERYPDYNNAIGSPPHTAQVSRHALLAALRRAEAVLLADSPAEPRQVRLSRQENSINVYAESQQTGSRADESLPAEFSHKTLLIGFMLHNLRESVQHIGGEVLRLRYNRHNTAVLLESDDDPATLQLVMPVLIKD